MTKNCVFFLLFVACACGKEINSFTEELLIKPLESGHVQSHFEFTTRWTSPQIQDSIEHYKDFEFAHYDLFPRALGEIIEAYHVRELHLSLTQGLWRHRMWGYPVVDAPPGAQLWVWFNPSVDNLDQTWRDLVNALSGLVCASLNFIDSTNTVSPELSYRPQGLAEEWYSANSSYLRYAALPRENVCTENLTPWKKLLPCDTKSGLSMLLHPTPLYTAHYHSLSIHLRPTCEDQDCMSSQLELVQALSLVQDPTVAMDGHQDWSLHHLFSTPLTSVCPLASKSMLYVDVTSNIDQEKNGFTLYPEPDSEEHSGLGDSLRRLAIYDIRKTPSNDPFNLEAHYKARHIYGFIPSPVLHVSRFITGYGQESGSITVKFTNTGSEKLVLVYLEVLPWYLRLFLHTSHHQDQPLYVSKLVTAQDRERGWLYEAVVEVGARSTVELSLEFSRALLKWLEYPPDANHGFYIPAATISAVLPSPKNVAVNNLRGSSLREKLIVKDGKSFIRIHTETLLVSLPTPDFSMPYNVICLACTVVALAFGPIHNITTKKLVLKKIEGSESPVGRFMKKVKNIFKRNKTEASQDPIEEPVIVEENPLYDHREELEDIKEEENEEDRTVSEATDTDGS